MVMGLGINEHTYWLIYTLSSAFVWCVVRQFVLNLPMVVFNVSIAAIGVKLHNVFCKRSQVGACTGQGERLLTDHYAHPRR